MIKEDTGQDHPALASRPTLRADCIKYLDAFESLSVSRLWSQVGPSRLQVSEISALLDILQVRRYEERRKFLRLIQIMDGVEVKHLLAQMRKGSKTK